ncbi:DUF2339 domain-containing protein [Rhodopila sp.]|jgi:uncharacterized membrane protein|uniref:DUF2339 domain-containing protein n=1 Tax=Rhodopila sp. TaxID=2480087 RepID=UPI002C3E4CB1|nr:DUF2339 domain-containing protein [Rhodopila sp.]HVZ08950.1 DUF2339 domain-containing protein [Rhodopila sp.]
MDEDAVFILLGFGAVAGWVLGVIGFVRAGRALAELRLLRTRLDQAAELSAARSIPAAADEATRARATRARAGSEAAGPAIATQAGPMPEAVSAPLSDTQPAPAGPVAADAMVERAASPAGQPADAPRPRRDLEAMLTTRWGTWAGAAALLMAAVFLVRYAVEQDLLGPAVRCTLAALLGVALVAAAEWLRRRPEAPAGLADTSSGAASLSDGTGRPPPAASATARFGPDLAPSALAAGGVGALFGAAYGAGVLYGLIPPLLGFALMGLVSITGLALALLHGPLVAAIGLVGAFATPALVQTEHPSMPGLFVYLLAVSAAALGVVRYTAWIWLAWSTTLAGALWVLVALAMGPGVDAWAPALFVPAAAALNLALLPGAALNHRIGRRLAWVPVGVLGLAGLALANDLQGWETRAGLLLLVPITVAKAATEPRLRRLPFLAAALSLLLFAGWAVDVTTWSAWLTPPPGWGPDQARALIGCAALTAGFLAASGLWFQDRRAQPLPWASLAAAVPVLTLAICYWRVTLLQTRADWAAAAFALAAGLTGVAALAIRGAAVFRGGTPDETPGAHLHRQIAGVHAAGAVAALSLGCAMLLADQWLTLAVALVLPALAWVEAKADLPPLRRVALAVAALVLIRLLANWYVLDYAFGTIPVLNGLIPAYGIPAAAFWLAARMFRRRADDLVVAGLELGAVAFATVLVALEIRLTAGGGSLTGGEAGFGEAALHVSALGILAVATMHLATRLNRPVLRAAWLVQGAAALAGAVLLLGPANPALDGSPAGSWPLLDWLLPAYLLPAVLAAWAMRHPATAHPGWLRRVLGVYALAAAFAWLTLELRHLWHGPDIDLTAGVLDAELWAWSAAWLAFGAALLLVGLRRHDKALRLAGLALVALSTAKVFIVDMSGLEGLWRVLSFLGLGLALIGLGTVYRRLAGGKEQ